jgi:hypothetical protein
LTLIDERLVAVRDGFPFGRLMREWRCGWLRHLQMLKFTKAANIL